MNKEKVLRRLPYFVQNLLVTAFNVKQYKMRHSGNYYLYKEYYKKVESMNSLELQEEIYKKTDKFLSYATKNSEWYKEYKNKKLSDFPILEKKDIINHLDKIKTISEQQGKVSLTGGTTGASMKVIADIENVQERFAILDNFRESYGYKLGKKTAWFSGKNLISKEQINKGICSNYDYINKIKFYSTFHINEKNFDIYWQSINKFKPEFIIGFPSSIYEICNIAKNRGLKIDNKVKVFFPTAETVLPIHREVIFDVLGCKTIDQYASSEGAPFILECPEGRLHIHPLTGIFEVVDENYKPTNSGKILVTSFTTKGTPLIRYNVGDSITLADPSEQCKCGSLFPLVNRIEGRTTDYILSKEYGKVNLGNLSNATKNVSGILCFQVQQYNLNELKVLIVKNQDYDSYSEKKFLNALKERVGEIIIKFDYVEHIEREKSGKFRIVKNFIDVK